MNYQNSPYYFMPYGHYPYAPYPTMWPPAPYPEIQFSGHIEFNNFGNYPQYQAFQSALDPKQERGQDEDQEFADPQKCGKTGSFFGSDPMENLIAMPKNKKIRKNQRIIERQSSGAQGRQNIIQSIAKEGQFSRRQQTANRNLNSNTLKVFFKQLRDPKTETSLNVHKIIEINKIGLSHQKFMKKINSVFPSSCTYISLDQLKKKLESNSEQEEHLNFVKILRTSIKRFYKYQIFTVNFKSARTTRKIRNQQIKQGKSILQELSL